MLSISSLLLVLTAGVLVNAQTHTGQLHAFTPGVGACGITSASTDVVASVSQDFFKTFPGATANPNKNPLCKHRITITANGKTVTAPIVDYAAGHFNDVGLSTTGFQTFAKLSDGVVPSVNWSID